MIRLLACWFVVLCNVLGILFLIAAAIIYLNSLYGPPHPERSRYNESPFGELCP